MTTPLEWALECGQLHELWPKRWPWLLMTDGVYQGWLREAGTPERLASLGCPLDEAVQLGHEALVSISAERLMVPRIKGILDDYERQTLDGSKPFRGGWNGGTFSEYYNGGTLAECREELECAYAREKMDKGGAP